MNSTLHEICEFKKPEDCYVLLGVARKKTNPSLTSGQEIVFREVIKNEAEIDRKYRKISLLCRAYEGEQKEKYNFYIYVTVNARNSIKAWFKLNNLLNIALTEKLISNVDLTKKLKNITNIWISALMKDECRSGKKFLIDIDTKEEDKITMINNCISRITFPLGIIRTETKNGFHVVINPFNREKFMELIKFMGLSDVCEVKTDALLFLEHIEVKE